MLDTKFIRENLEAVQKAALNKNRKVEWDKLLDFDDRKKELGKKIQELRTERNELAGDRGQGTGDREKGKKIKEELKKLEEEEREVNKELNRILLTVPNVPHPSVPVGKDETGNVEVRKEGKIPHFDFTPLDHI